MVFQNLCESSIRCNISVLALVCSGNGCFELPEWYIMVDHVVDRSLCRAMSLWRYVVLECWSLGDSFVRFA